MSESNTSVKSFAELIPYVSKVKSKSEAARSNYPFWNQDENTNLYRDHISIAIFIGLISLFSTSTQLLFVIYAPAPYRWISLAFLILGQLSCFVCYLVSMIFIDDQPNSKIHQLYHQYYIDEEVLLMIGSCCGCLFTPICPIVIPILHHFCYDDWKPLITTTAPSVAISMFQSYPQIIILTIMITATDYTLSINSIITWSFIACALSIIALSIQIASVFEQSTVFIVNSIWLLFDCVLALCIVSAIMYDHITLAIFYVDIALYSIWMLMWIIIILILFISPLICGNYTEFEMPEFDDVVSTICICICGIIFMPFGLGFFTLCTGIGIGLVSIFVIPILMYFHLFTIIWFFMLDYLYGWNVCPMSLRLIKYEHDGWDRYILFDWIKNGENIEERNDRLYSINMVILDYDTELKIKYQKLFDNMVTNIRNSTRSSKQSVHQMTSEIDQFFVLNFENQELNSISQEYMGKLSFLMKWTMIYFPINRIIHCIIPFIIILYIGWSVQWNMDEINLFSKGLYGSLLILFILCSICIGIGWKSLYYHRLILPINKDSWSDYNLDSNKLMNWNKFATYTSNCHYYIISLKIVVDWCESKGGDKYIGYIIMNLCGVTQPPDFEYSDNLV